MNDPAREAYNDIKTFKDVERFWKQKVPEGTYLDFSTSPNGKGKLTDDNKKKIREAASGFAHQEGGIVVWGIVAKKGPDGDHADKPDAIKKLAAFHGDLEDFSKNAVEPGLNILHKKIHFKDDPSVNEGFIVSYFPKSDLFHRAIGMPYDFYRRFGSSFVPLTTRNDFEALLSRNVAPDLELRVDLLSRASRNVDGKDIPIGFNLRFSLRNNGRGIAKNPSILLGGNVNFGVCHGQDLDVWTAQEALNSVFRKQLIPKAGTVVHPEQEIFVLSIAIPAGRVHPIAYKCFAEGMEPKVGSIDLGPLSLTLMNG